MNRFVTRWAAGHLSIGLFIEPKNKTMFEAAKKKVAEHY
jgi:hypothetical protein